MTRITYADGLSYDPETGEHFDVFGRCYKRNYRPLSHEERQKLENRSGDLINQGLKESGVWGRRPERQVKPPVNRQLTDTEMAFLDSIHPARRPQFLMEWATRPGPEPGFESSTVKNLKAEEQYLEKQIEDLEATKAERKRLLGIARETLNEAAWNGLTFQEKLQWARDWEREQAQSI